MLSLNPTTSRAITTKRKSETPASLHFFRSVPYVQRRSADARVPPDCDASGCTIQSVPSPALTLRNNRRAAPVLRVCQYSFPPLYTPSSLLLSLLHSCPLAYSILTLVSSFFAHSFPCPWGLRYPERSEPSPVCGVACPWVRASTCRPVITHTTHHNTSDTGQYNARGLDAGLVGLERHMVPLPLSPGDGTYMLASACVSHVAPVAASLAWGRARRSTWAPACRHW